MSHKAQETTQTTEAQVLTKALLRLTKKYELSGKDLSAILGISEAGVTRLHQGKKLILPATKEGEMVLLLLRLYRSLNALLGNNPEKAKAWLNSYNTYFSNKPIDQIKSVTGLVQVVDYLDGIRGKV